MKNFIFIAVFVAVLAFGTTGYSEESEVVGKTTEGISFDELQAQDEKLFATISDGIANIKEVVKIINESTELLEEINKEENARLLREMEEGREEYRQAIEKYFSSSS